MFFGVGRNGMVKRKAIEGMNSRQNRQVAALESKPGPERLLDLSPAVCYQVSTPH